MKLHLTKDKILILVIVVLLIFSSNLFSKKTRNFFYSISAPVQKVLWSASDIVFDYFGGLFKAKNIKQELEKIKLENQKLLTDNVALKETKAENDILRKALGIGLAEEFQLSFAEVIGKYAEQDSILIDKGYKDGLSENMPVITEERVLVGKIEKTYKDFSRVALISKKENSFDVRISGSDIEGLIRGDGGSEVHLDLIPKKQEIKSGDLIISTSLGGIYPDGLLVGKVKKVEKSDVKPFQQAEVSPFLELRGLYKVFVVLK